jgi:hypothetical protein
VGPPNSRHEIKQYAGGTEEDRSGSVSSLLDFSDSTRNLLSK